MDEETLTDALSGADDLPGQPVDQTSGQSAQEGERPALSDAAPYSAPSPASGARLVGLLRRLGLDTLYVLTALPLGVAAFVVASVGLSLGVGTLIVWVGVPVLSFTLVAASGFARLERLRLEQWQGRRVTRPVYLRARPEDAWLRRLLTPLRDPQNWLDVLWATFGWIVSTVVFVLVVALWAEALAGVTYPLWAHWLPEDNGGPVTSLLVRLSGGEQGGVVDLSISVAVGLLTLALLPWLVRGCAWVNEAFADLVLNARGELSEQVRREQGARAAAQRAEAASFRRLERDIHDGPQQRLVRLTMDLGRARHQLGTDPEKAAAAVDDALHHARETLEELRALSRGIAPPLLVDRGLGVALDELAMRGAVAVEMTHDLPPGLSPHVETAVYFTVSEALTNVAKHSGAGQAFVRVAGEDGFLLVEVLDHGTGGAHPGKGQGLAGLAQRLRAVGGDLAVDSPVGGPTLVAARIPLRG